MYLSILYVISTAIAHGFYEEITLFTNNKDLDNTATMHDNVNSRQLLSVPNISLGTWTTGSSKLPITDYNMASFLYNNSIYLFGGAGQVRNKQLIEYHVPTRSFTNVSIVLSVPCEGDAQFYTQINNMGYWAGQNTISRYDLQSKQLFPDDITGVNNTMGDICLASHNNLLFVVGGSYETIHNYYPILRKVHIYNLSSQIWLDGVPMHRPRAELTCLVHPQYDMLYAIGGENVLYVTLDYEVIIEKVYIDDNIVNNPWVETEHNLLIGVAKARAVIYQHYIVVIGGTCQYYPQDMCPGAVDAVQLINVITDEVSFGPALNGENQQVGAVYNGYDNAIYVFGGYIKDTYTYLKIETNDPTSSPTASPSNNPTDEPTYDPTKKPTSSPTKDPTSSPTVSPSNNPTYEPTYDPTEKPTSSPTNNPTPSPTVSPSNNPTYAPTYDPTKQPTSSPTNDPTSSPTAAPSRYPTAYPTPAPTTHPTYSPTNKPSNSPVKQPTATPTAQPTQFPSKNPTLSPSRDPTPESFNPSSAPTRNSTVTPTKSPTNDPMMSPTSKSTVFEQSTALSTDDNEPNDNGDGQSSSNSVNQTIDIILIVLFAVLFVIFLVLWLKTRSEKNALFDSISNPNNGGPYIAMTDNDDDVKDNSIQ